jgi:hypothetical protein
MTMGEAPSAAYLVARGGAQFVQNAVAGAQYVAGRTIDAAGAALDAVTGATGTPLYGTHPRPWDQGGRPAAGTPLTREERSELFNHLTLHSADPSPFQDAQRQIDHLLQDNPDSVRDMWKDVLSGGPRPPLPPQP